MTRLSRAKTLLPLSMRRALKTGFAAAHDLAAPIRLARVPPRRHTLIGGGDFVAVGTAIHRVLVECGLRPDMAILEPGCGQGRIARPMVGWLRAGIGSYTGFDVDRRMIDWCERAYADQPDFTFHHIDAGNALYNSGGAVAASDVRFPASDASIDFLYITSVLTHMHAEDTRHYLSEAARVLRAGGRCVVSWFMIADNGPTDRMGFHHALPGGSRTTVAKLAEAAIAHPRAVVEGAYRDSGLTVNRVVQGEWSGGPGLFGLQDVIVADRP